MNHRLARGFTLTELLVVIAIIGILMGIIVPSIVYMQSQAKRDAVKTDMKRLSAGLESYKRDFGRYPPSHLNHVDENLRLNNLNNGSEALTAFLMTEKMNGPYVEWNEERYANTDNDAAPENLTNWFFGDNQLREMTDQWNNPIVYIHNLDYENQQKIGLYINKRGDKFRVNPAKNPKTSTYYSPNKYQLWSMGPNNRNQNGSGDDIPSW